jgi:hypothetical protein
MDMGCHILYQDLIWVEFCCNLTHDGLIKTNSNATSLKSAP